MCLASGFIYHGADANGSCVVNGLDVTYLTAYLKGIGPAPFFCPTCPCAPEPNREDLLVPEGITSKQKN